MPVRKTKVKGCRLRGENYYLNCRVKGIPLTECVGPDPKLAAAALAKRKAEIWEGVYFPEKLQSSLKILDILNDYWKERLKFKKSAYDRKFHLTRMREEFGAFPAMSLDIARLEDYQRRRLIERRTIRTKNGVKFGQQIKPRSVNADVNELQAALNLAVSNRRLKYNPIADLKNLDEGEPARVMLDDGHDSGQQWLKLYNAAGDDLKPILECQYETGMRIGEVLALRWSWVDEINKIIELPAKNVKTQKSRRVPISGRLQALLISIPRTSELVFPDRHGNQRQGCKKAFDGAVKGAGWERGTFTSHALRRTRGQIWDRVSKDLSCAALGHDEKVHRHNYTEVKADMLQALTVQKVA